MENVGSFMGASHCGVTHMWKKQDPKIFHAIFQEYQQNVFKNTSLFSIPQHNTRQSCTHFTNGDSTKSTLFLTIKSEIVLVVEVLWVVFPIPVAHRGLLQLDRPS